MTVGQAVPDHKVLLSMDTLYPTEMPSGENKIQPRNRGLYLLYISGGISIRRKSSMVSSNFQQFHNSVFLRGSLGSTYHHYKDQSGSVFFNLLMLNQRETFRILNIC